ncbi:hypothetical protein KR018_011965 [Drosophila ironensis]|nr:hypothetical protein KR018_011965 [Drosophila ironensis]
MLATSLLGRRNCPNLKVFNSWRKLLGTTKHYTSKSALNNPFGEPYHPQKSFTRNYQNSKSMDCPPDIFNGRKDRFAGITVDGRQESLDICVFREKLKRSLEVWKAKKNRAIWFRVYKDQSDCVPVLAENGFDFHHARTGVVVMYRWLPEQESVNLPTYAHTMMGVGGLVVNDQDEVLVVTDRYAMIPDSWKLPGGYVEPGENFVEAAIREVAEETGIKTEFRSMVSLRHTHGGNFNCSDVYIVMALKPLNLELKPCEREIARAKWMPIQEYMQHPQVHETNRKFLATYLDYKKRNVNIICSEEEHQVLKRRYHLYYVEPEKTEQCS